MTKPKPKVPVVQQMAARRREDAPAEDAPPTPVVVAPAVDANNGTVVAPSQPGVREAAVGEFFAPTTTDEEQARLDDLERQATAAQTAPSQWAT